MTLSVESTQIAVKNVQTRMPFAFGSVTIQALPHIFVELSVRVDGNKEVGIASDHAMPKWFRKDPEKSVTDDIEDILKVVEHACEAASEISTKTAFSFWRRVHAEQTTWAEREGIPPLLANFGVTFVERAVIDGVCRHENTTFAKAVRKNKLGIKPGRVYSETEGMELREVLPDNPRRSIAVRHTVGMEDPLTENDIVDPINDGLPETLKEYIRVDGVRYVKCKLGGDPDADFNRLEQIARVLDDTLDHYGVTLDANEQYHAISDLEELWSQMAAQPALQTFVDNIICIEQPLDRDLALSVEAGEMLGNWDGPPIIVDEADGEVDSLKTALDLGYDGTSVKSCKGVFKGLVNACLVDYRSTTDNRPYLLTGEDLTTIGPVSLEEDLALMATMGFSHIERNGHHYIRGADILSSRLEDQLIENHGGLYHRHERGFTALDIDDGDLRLDSVVEAPYGRKIDFDLSCLTPLEEWSVCSLGLES
ncbi:hypothetical protein [Halosimplex amylolyticum]|uniref:hypothetical protein n=1 Tax=Halosimplex amylolyticum TaxID=3396616 RepID=UPI003F55B29C